MILNTMGQCKMKCDIILLCNKKCYVVNRNLHKEFKRRVSKLVPKKHIINVFHVLHQRNNYSTQHNNTVDNKIPLFL